MESECRESARQHTSFLHIHRSRSFRLLDSFSHCTVCLRLPSCAYFDSRTHRSHSITQILRASAGLHSRHRHHHDADSTILSCHQLCMFFATAKVSREKCDNPTFLPPPPDTAYTRISSSVDLQFPLSENANWFSLSSQQRQSTQRQYRDRGDDHARQTQTVPRWVYFFTQNSMCTSKTL